MALFKILKGSKKNLPTTKTEGYMYITEDVGDIYVDFSASKRIRLNAEAAEKIRKITYNSDGSYKSEVSLDYDDIMAKNNPTGTGSLSLNRKANTVIGDNSVAVGSNTTASGKNSFATGESTIASGDQQHVQGRYNISDTTSAHIVGNGTATTESNAHTLDWDGNAWFAGNVYVGSTSGTNKDGGSVKLIRSDDIASDTKAGLTIVYPEVKCTTFSSDSGTITPLAAQKAAEMFAITRPPKRKPGNPANPGTAGTCTPNNIVRWLNAAGDVQDSKITIEDVINSRDNSEAQVIAIPASGNKKMVYGYCTDQVDGTSFIGGIFPADATEYPYTEGLAIGGTSGNLLWKGNRVATTDMIFSGNYNDLTNKPTIPTVNNATLTIQKNGTNVATFTANSASNVTANITVPTGAAANKGVDTSISAASTSANLPTSQAVAAFVEGKGYKTTDNNDKVTCTKATTTKYYVAGTTSSTTSTTGLTYDTGVYVDTTAGKLVATSVYGAVWNDYAEYRTQIEDIKPGYCVASTNDGKVYKTTEKFQPCDGIVSDTFGFAIGETKENKTPLAVAGRVLAYCEGDRNDYHSGDTVGAGPDGKVIKMTREDIQKWPDRIVGIVSEIPQYETWGTGNVLVDGRIWIKIK